MKSIHILDHSISPFAGQFPDTDFLHYNTGIPMLFARAIRSRYPEIEAEVWRPERTLHHLYTWQDDVGIVHRVFPSLFICYRMEVSVPLLSAVKALKDSQVCIWVHGIYNLHAYLLAPLLRSASAIAQSDGGFPAKATFKLSERRWLRYLYLPLHPIQRLTLRQYPRIFAISTEEKGFLQDILSIPASRIVFSPTGIDFNHFSPGDKQLARIACGLDQGSKIILYVGRLSKEKGIEYLVQAFTVIAAQHTHAELFIVGTGPLQQTLEQQVSTLDLENCVHFVGYVEPAELPDWYRAADLTVMPSLYEWFGKVAAESMACGTPVVVTRAGGAIDIVNEFECGIVISPKNASEMAKAISSILTNSVNTHPNIERARRKFDWSVKLSQAFSLFEKTINAELL